MKKLTLISVAILVLMITVPAMAGEPDCLAEAERIANEIKDKTFVTCEGTSCFRRQETIVQISDPLEDEITDVYASEPSKSEILNGKKFQYNFSLVPTLKDFCEQDIAMRRTYGTWGSNWESVIYHIEGEEISKITPKIALTSYADDNPYYNKNETNFNEGNLKITGWASIDTVRARVRFDLFPRVRLYLGDRKITVNVYGQLQ